MYPASAFSILPLRAFTSANPDTGRISNRDARSNTNREGSRSLPRETSSLSKLEFLEAGEGSNRATVSVDKTRADERAAVLLEQSLSSQVLGKRLARQRAISMLDQAHLAVRFLTSTPAETEARENLLNYLSLRALARCRSNKTRAMQMSRPRATLLAGHPAVI